SAGILVFVYQYILKLFLITPQHVLIVLKSINDPVDHIVKIIAVAGPHHLLKHGELPAGGPQFFYLFFLFLYLVPPNISFLIFFGGAFADVFITAWKIINVFIDLSAYKIRRPAFFFHQAEKSLQAVDLEIYVTTVALQRMIFAKS